MVYKATWHLLSISKWLSEPQFWQKKWLEIVIKVIKDFRAFQVALEQLESLYITDNSAVPFVILLFYVSKFTNQRCRLHSTLSSYKWSTLKVCPLVSLITKVSYETFNISPLILPSWPVQSGIISFILFDVCYPITSNRICEATNKVQKKKKLLGIHKPTSIYQCWTVGQRFKTYGYYGYGGQIFFWKFKASKRHSAINWPLCRLIDNEINVE